MSQYIHFTEEQKDQAASVDLESFLLHRGEKLIASGHEKRLARDLHLSDSTVKRALNDLEKAGFIKRENRFRTYNKKTYGKTSNLYTVL